MQFKTKMLPKIIARMNPIVFTFRGSINSLSTSENNLAPIVEDFTVS